MKHYLDDSIPKQTLRFKLVEVEERFADREDNADCRCLRTALDRVATRYERERAAEGFTVDWKVRVGQDLSAGAEVLAWVKGQCYPITEAAFGCLMLYLYPPKPKRIVAVGETVGEYGSQGNPIQGLTSDTQEEVDRRSFTNFPIEWCQAVKSDAELTAENIRYLLFPIAPPDNDALVMILRKRREVWMRETTTVLFYQWMEGLIMQVEHHIWPLLDQIIDCSVAEAVSSGECTLESVTAFAVHRFLVARNLAVRSMELTIFWGELKWTAPIRNSHEVTYHEFKDADRAISLEGLNLSGPVTDEVLRAWKIPVRFDDVMMSYGRLNRPFTKLKGPACMICRVRDCELPACVNLYYRTEVLCVEHDPTACAIPPSFNLRARYQNKFLKKVSTHEARMRESSSHKWEDKVFGSVGECVDCAKMLWSYMTTHLTNEVVNVEIGESLDMRAVTWVGKALGVSVDLDERERHKAKAKAQFLSFAVGAPHSTMVTEKSPAMLPTGVNLHLSQIMREIDAVSICSYLDCKDELVNHYAFKTVSLWRETTPQQYFDYLLMALIKTHFDGGQVCASRYYMEPWQSTTLCEPDLWSETLVKKIDKMVVQGHGLDFTGEVGKPPDSTPTSVASNAEQAIHVAALLELRDNNEYSSGSMSRKGASSPETEREQEATRFVSPWLEEPEPQTAEAREVIGCYCDMILRIVDDILTKYKCESAAARMWQHLQLQQMLVRKKGYLHASLLQDFATDLACGAEAANIEEFYEKRFAKFGQGKVIWRRLTRNNADALVSRELSGMRIVIVESPADLGEVWNHHGGKDRPYQIVKPNLSFDAMTEDGTKAGGIALLTIWY